MTSIQPQVHPDFEEILIEAPRKASKAKTWEQIFSRLEEEGFAGSAARIKDLHECEDFEEGEKALSKKSVQYFLEFFLQCGNLGEPLLGLCPDGMLSAEWESTDQHHLAMKFFDNGLVFSSILDADGKFTLSKKDNFEHILTILTEYGIQKW